MIAATCVPRNSGRTELGIHKRSLRRRVNCSAHGASAGHNPSQYSQKALTPSEHRLGTRCCCPNDGTPDGSGRYRRPNTHLSRVLMYGGDLVHIFGIDMAGMCHMHKQSQRRQGAGRIWGNLNYAAIVSCGSSVTVV